MIKGRRGPDSKYATSPDPNAKNFDLEKSLLDALSAVAESPKAPSPEDIGQRMENVATGIEKTSGAADAAKETKKPNSNGNGVSNGQKTWTYDPIKVIWGDDDSVSWIVNQKEY